MNPMYSWLGDKLTSLVADAAKAANIDEKMVCGFDGDAWVWQWRASFGSEDRERFAETIFEARPDAFEEGFETEVSAMTWAKKYREISWSRTYSKQ